MDKIKKLTKNELLSSLGIRLLQMYSRDGLTLSVIAKKIGWDADEFLLFVEKNRKISEALILNDEKSLAEVEEALYRSARGFTKIVKRPIKFQKQLKSGHIQEVVEIMDEEIYIKPDVKAQIFILTNKKPDVWQERRDSKLNIALEPVIFKNEDKIQK